MAVESGNIPQSSSENQPSRLRNVVEKIAHSKAAEAVRKAFTGKKSTELPTATTTAETTTTPELSSVDAGVKQIIDRIQTTKWNQETRSFDEELSTAEQAAVTTYLEHNLPAIAQELAHQIFDNPAPSLMADLLKQSRMEIGEGSKLQLPSIESWQEEGALKIDGARVVGAFYDTLGCVRVILDTTVNLASPVHTTEDLSGIPVHRGVKSQQVPVEVRLYFDRGQNRIATDFMQLVQNRQTGQSDTKMAYFEYTPPATDQKSIAPMSLSLDDLKQQNIPSGEGFNPDGHLHNSVVVYPGTEGSRQVSPIPENWLQTNVKFLQKESAPANT